MATHASWQAVCEQIIRTQKKNQNIKRDKDITEICLNDRKLEGVCDFTKYTNLKYLWLSNNRLRRLNGIQCNYRISELHLQYNLLKDISGALAHLTQLQVLMLQGNQLTNLEKVVREFRKMQSLAILNLFDNPLAQERDYRHYTIYSLPSVEILDRKEVKSKERHTAITVYDQLNEGVRQTIAFLRRTEGPPDLYHRRTGRPRLTTPALSASTESFIHRPSTAELEKAFDDRVKTKAVWTYNYLDWSKIPTPLERRLAKSSNPQPEILSIAFK